MPRIKSLGDNKVVMYARSAGALARMITAEGTPTTKEQCQMIIDNLANDFPVAWKWLQDNMAFAVENEYLENTFGACRYFPGARNMDESRQAAVRREASNSNIQGLVAYLLAQAGKNFYKLKHMSDLAKDVDFRLILPIHDAFLIECKDEHIAKCKEFIIMCMSTYNKIPGTNYNLLVDIEVFKRWGEKTH